MGIDKTIESLNSINDLVIQGISIVKAGGLNLNALKRLPAIIGDIYVICKDAHGVMPELKDLDSDEAKQLNDLCFVSIKKIVAAVAA